MKTAVIRVFPGQSPYLTLRVFMISRTIESVRPSHGSKSLWWQAGLDVAFLALVLSARPEWHAGAGAAAWSLLASTRVKRMMRFGCHPVGHHDVGGASRAKRDDDRDGGRSCGGTGHREGLVVACVRLPKPDGGWQVSKRKFSTMTADVCAHGLAR